MRHLLVYGLFFATIPCYSQNTKTKTEIIPGTQPTLEVKKDGVNLHGQIKLSSLAGNGKQQVWVDENGVLGTQGGPRTEAITYYYNVGPASFVKTNPSSTYLMYNQVYRVFLATGASEAIAAPLNLPHGATVTSIRVVFMDNTTYDLRIQFLMTKIGINGTFILSQFYTSGNMTVERSVTSNPLAYPIDNDNEYYTVSITPLSGQTWMNSLLYIKAIVFTYEL